MGVPVGGTRYIPQPPRPGLAVAFTYICHNILLEPRLVSHSWSIYPVNVCGSCPTEVRSMDISKPGCCGFKLRTLLVLPENKKSNMAEPYLLVREFKLPLVSNHLCVPTDVRDTNESKYINNEKMLTPTKERFLKNMGKNRAKASLVNNMMADQFGEIQVSKSPTNRVMKKGRVEAFGKDADEPMLILVAEGLKLKE